MEALEKLVNRLSAEQNAPRQNPNVTSLNCFKKRHVQREWQANYDHSGRLTCGRLASLNKASEEGRKDSALDGGGNGFYLEGSICVSRV
ncbi:hypothetical protein AVEN_158905-1 [Araneus ventricosus]|uniref:Uncharacterized protein n=1 Tax=Araneus ventricosus TaxID=182803 RepID=A0A4Y2B9P5_ARAVE|nr:hypothetical protein AVEN_158905-1 [Araneus ventricosus]